MARTRKFSELAAPINADPARRARVDAAKDEIGSVLALGELRESLERTQRELAEALASTQANVSRIERQDDLYLSTLASYVKALGGELEVAAVFPDRRVLISPKP